MLLRSQQPAASSQPFEKPVPPRCNLVGHSQQKREQAFADGRQSPNNSGRFGALAPGNNPIPISAPCKTPNLQSQGLKHP